MNKTVGTAGRFNFLSPYDAINTTKRLEIVSIKDITELERDGLNPYELIYKDVGLTVEDKEKDSRDKVKIITLTDGTGYVNIPEKYLSEFVDTNGIQYECKTIGINLGTLPKDIDFDNLKNDIINLVEMYIGVVPRVEVLSTSAITFLSKDEDSAFTTNRNILQTTMSNYALRYIELKKEYDTLAEKKESLECYIKTTL